MMYVQLLIFILLDIRALDVQIVYFLSHDSRPLNCKNEVSTFFCEQRMTHQETQTIFGEEKKYSGTVIGALHRA